MAPLDALMRRLPRRRTALKVVHWSMLPLVIWFFVVTPEDTVRGGPWLVALHSDLGLVFTSLSLLWVADWMRRGLASRPGPKLRGWARPAHRAMHTALIGGLGVLALTGFGLGLTSAVMLKAGGIVPIAPPLGLPAANEVVGAVHAAVFYALFALVAAHALFHLWRHVALNDGALRIMMPRALHRFL